VNPSSDENPARTGRDSADERADVDDELRTREWSRLRYFDPRLTLPRMRTTEIQIARHGSHLPRRLRELRTNGTKRFRELRDAAIFCYGMATSVLGKPVYYANHESEDFDVIARFVDEQEETDNYVPLQLKELPPEDLNPTATIEGIYHSLKSRQALRRTVVAIKLNNRDGVLTRLPRPRFVVAGLWFFWKTSQEHDSWCLFGDAMQTSPRAHHFLYPDKRGAGSGTA
jgi:hypothetical protein